MKQLLFLLLFPCLALAQYQGNANQKITLGEQTTADGLVFRGRASIDTVTATSKITRANKQDTSTFILLDTVTNLLWHYKTASNGWTQAGGSTLDTATMLLPYYRAGRNTIIQAGDVPTLNQNTTGSAATLTTGRTIQTNLASTSAATFNGSANITPGVTGTLPVANGGTNTSTAFTAGSVVFAGTSGTYTQDNSNLFWDDTYNRLGIGTTSPFSILEILNGNGDTRMTITSTGNTGSSDFRLINSTGTVSYDWLFQAIASNGNFRIYDNAGASTGERFSIDQSGNVGIGTASPAVQFHTTAGVRFATFAGGGTTTLSVDNNGDLARTSSIELKKDVTPINYGLNEILQINPINFNWIDENKFGNENENGFIAEDVMSVIPNVVAADTHGLFMDYTKLIPILTKAIQEQQALIKALEQRILNLENK